MAKLKLKFKTLEAKTFSKMLSAIIILKLKFWAQNYVILNHVDLNHNNTNLNYSDHVNLNQTDFNQLIPTNFTTINYSDNVCGLNKMLSQYGDSADAAASTVSTKTPLAYVP